MGWSLKCAAPSFLYHQILPKERGVKETRQFFLVAFGSGSELETQIKIAKRLQFVSDEQSKKSDALLEEVMKMLNKMSYY